MTEKKIPTAQQMKEYRDLRGSMTTESDFEKVQAFENGKMGVKDALGEVFVPAEYDEIGYDLITEPVYESYDIVGESDYLQVVKDGVTGYIDESGEFTTDEDERFFHAACDF